MLRRHWGIILALGTAAVGAPLIWLTLQPLEPNLPRYEYGEGSAPQHYPGGRNCRPAVLSALPDPRQAAREHERCAEEAEKHRLESDDLVQQTRAANAAEAQVQLAHQMAWMGLYGTIGGFLTLLAAGMAAFYAREAARHTEAGVSETRRIGETQSRAYLSVIRADIHIGRREEVFPDIPSVDVFLHFHNSGVTPAVNISYHCTAGISNWRDIETPLTIDTVPFHQFVNNIPPAQTSKFRATCFGIAPKLRENTARWAGFTENTPFGDAPVIIIYGVVFYEDVFGDTFRSQFNFWLEEQPHPTRPIQGRDDLPTIQARIPTFERISDRADYIVPLTPKGSPGGT